MFLRLLPMVGASVLSLWVATFIAMPRKPLPNNEVEELVYTRLLGRHHRVFILALIGTVLGLLVLLLSMASSATATPDGTLSAHQICFNTSGSPLTCYTQHPGGAWLEEELQVDTGTWRAVGTSYVAPQPPGKKDDTP